MPSPADYEAWLRAVVAAPHDAGVRMAFLDWLQEADPDRCNPASPWWRDFTRPDGWWAVEAVFDPRDPGDCWTVLLWCSFHVATGLALVRGDRVPACEDCGGNAGRLAAESGAWRCDACADRVRFGGLYRVHGGDGRSPAVYDDIPF